MILVLASLAALAASAVAALACASRPRVATTIAALGSGAALGLALSPAVSVLSGAGPLGVTIASTTPLLGFHLGLDALSAFFLLAILGLAALTAVYGIGYLGSESGPRAGLSSFFLNLLTLSMSLVVLARHAVLFLVAWEAMALTSFFLVAHYSERRETRKAAWVYLVATHLGSLFVVSLFLVLGHRSGSFAFDGLGRGLTPAGATLCFLLAVVGFGTKAGLMPFHVWLPEAHPAAPSHVSALMSGVMIKTGIYGLVRILTLLGPPPLWWGWLLLGLGGASALLGVLFALAQHDLKRLLAYHSIENVGIIVAGLGVGMLGMAADMPLLAALGFAGALLHVVNHAVFKGLLFLGAGSVLHATGTAELDELGGIRRYLPITATTFLVGAAAIAGLPPLNGFVSEWLIYWGALSGITAAAPAVAIPCGAFFAVLATVGGLALACFAKAFGIVFLGQPRSERALECHEAPPSMRVPMVLLATACVGLGLAGPLLIPVLSPVVAGLAGPGAAATLGKSAGVLQSVTLVAGVLIFAAALLAVLRRLVLRTREIRTAGTWDCGYSAPAATMQYTASSFAQPIVDLYGAILRTRKRVEPPEIHFPDAAHVATETPDIGREGVYDPLFEGIDRNLRRMHVMQHGRVQIYVLGVVLTLLALLLWQVR